MTTQAHTLPELPAPLGARVTAQQAGVGTVVVGVFHGLDAATGFALVSHTTGTGRLVTGRFPVASITRT